MIYAFQIICAPRYPHVIVACSGFREWSATKAALMDYRVYNNDNLHDHWRYLKNFLGAVHLPDMETLITESLSSYLPQQLYNYYGGKYTVVNTEGHLVKGILGHSETNPEEREKAMAGGNSAFRLLEELEVFTRKALQQTIATDIATRLARFKSGGSAVRPVKPFDRAFIGTMEFSKVEQLHQIDIPADIKYFYEHIGAPDNDFHREIRRLCTEGTKAGLIVQISASFAMAIIETYKALTEDEKADLKHQVEKLDSHNDLQQYSNMLSYLLSEGIDHYDFRQDSFRISVIEDARSKVIADKPYFNVVLFLWAHCGGWGGIVLRGENPSYDGGAIHDEEYLEIVSEGQIFEYRSVPAGLRDEHHLFEYRDLIVAR